MYKWIIVYWLTHMNLEGVRIQHYDSRCNCYYDEWDGGQWVTDTARAEFRTKKRALKFVSNNLDYTGWRLDSVKRK